MEIKAEDITENGDIFEKIKGNILYRPNYFKVMDYSSVKIDEFEIGHIISEKAEGYEITIDAGNMAHFVVVVTKSGEKLTLILEKLLHTSSGKKGKRKRIFYLKKLFHHLERLSVF